jgi:CRISPR-associated protein (TIGR03984 family)
MLKVYLATDVIPNCTPKDAIDKISSKEVKGTLVSLAYSPSCCVFATWDKKNSGFKNLDSEAMENLYEFRVFCDNIELRWVRERSGDTGSATIMREFADSGKGGEEYLSLPGSYLLWGTVQKSTQKNATLFDPRVGSIKIPASAATHSRIAMSYKEYFRKGECGNLFFFAERLTGLSTIEIE